ncbi:hypothetical protein C8R44DRAFT_881742 [Mycena epipterygia]|nr:hypothetical protein C8R44DRAFT_881742 [Mycena epipterygia]
MLAASRTHLAIEEEIWNQQDDENLNARVGALCPRPSCICITFLPPFCTHCVFSLALTTSSTVSDSAIPVPVPVARRHAAAVLLPLLPPPIPPSCLPNSHSSPCHLRPSCCPYIAVFPPFFTHCVVIAHRHPKPNPLSLHDRPLSLLASSIFYPPSSNPLPVCPLYDAHIHIPITDAPRPLSARAAPFLFSYRNISAAFFWALPRFAHTTHVPLPFPSPSSLFAALPSSSPTLRVGCPSPTLRSCPTHTPRFLRLLLPASLPISSRRLAVPPRPARSLLPISSTSLAPAVPLSYLSYLSYLSPSASPRSSRSTSFRPIHLRSRSSLSAPSFCAHPLTALLPMAYDLRSPLPDMRELSPHLSPLSYPRARVLASFLPRLPVHPALYTPIRNPQYPPPPTPPSSPSPIALLQPHALLRALRTLISTPNRDPRHQRP